MNKHQDSPSFPLPKGWTKQIKSAAVHLFSLVRLSVARVQGQAVDDKDANPFEIHIQRLEHKVRILQERLRIADLRMSRIPPHRRPRYSPIERMQILELKALCGWSYRQTARRFLVAPATISSWLQRADEQGLHPILKIVEPVNKFPDFVRYSVQRLKVLCPQLGKSKMAEVLCRAGLHLSASTVGRIIKQPPVPTNDDDSGETKEVERAAQPEKPKPVVTAKYPGHVWNVDLTVVPVGGGLSTTWLPFSLPQVWPFCWWVAVVMDHYSRSLIGFAVFKQQPTSIQVRRLLGRAMSSAKSVPKYMISDQGKQFQCKGYKSWCKRKGIKPRFGAVGEHGSIAVLERLMRTFKEFTRSILVSLYKNKFRQDVACFADWYNEHRPHAALKGKTPNEVYFQVKRPANSQPRIEPRKRWPRGSPCARPQTLVAGQPGDRFLLQVDFHKGKRHLPIVSLIRAA